MISVVIPAYNSSATIREAVASVVAQGCPECEIIVVDDQSSDNTVQVAESVSIGAHLRLKVLSLSRNSGPAAARNRGIAEAKGDWIAFLDADDAWLPGKLDMQLECVRQNPDIVLVCGRTRTEGDETEKGGKGEAARSRPLTLDDFITGNPVATSTVLVKREAVLAVGGFDEEFRGPEDYDLWMRLAARYKLMKLDAPLAFYRTVPGSLSLDDRKFLPMVLRVLEKAFGSGGVLFGRRECYSAAVSNQYWNASWMAFNRAARLTAISYWSVAYVKNLGAARKVERKWLGLLIRYLVGKRAAA